MENQNTFDMTENIPDEMFEIIGLEKDEEVPARPRIGYWADAWRRFKENKVALLAGIFLLFLYFSLYSDRPSAGMDMRKLIRVQSIRDQVQHIGSEQMTLDVICLPEYGRRDVSLF